MHNIFLLLIIEIQFTYLHNNSTYSVTSHVHLYEHDWQISD